MRASGNGWWGRNAMNKPAVVGSLVVIAVGCECGGFRIGALG